MAVLLTISTTREPATDLGYLLVKHPDRVHEFDLPTGRAYVVFPEANQRQCTAALIVEVDPDRLAGRRGRHRTPDDFALSRFVNDRPYAASSLFAAALNRVFHSALRGASLDRPELAAQAIPLCLRIPVLRCRGGAGLAERLFAPLGWRVEATELPLDPTHPEWGTSPYVDLTLAGTIRLADALSQLYVLLPVCDDAKHYWVSPDEIDKLLRAGEGWLARHPERALIARRYLTHRRALTVQALSRLDALRAADDAADPDTVDTVDEAVATADEEAEMPSAVRRAPLAAQRHQAVLAALEHAGSARVLDLGCGSGALLAELARDKRYTRIVGADVSPQVLRLAERRLHLDRTPPAPGDRVSLVQTALTYTDDRLVGFDAAVLMEVIEHLDPPRLPALTDAVFGHARPSTVVVTTPNVEYNARYEGMATGALRHHDHRFEWSRDQFATWCAEISSQYGYEVVVTGIGDDDAEVGRPTQLAVFTVRAAA